MQTKYSKGLAKTKRKIAAKCRAIERKRRQQPRGNVYGIYRCP